MAVVGVLISLGILGALVAYVRWRLVVATELTGRWRTLGTAAILALVLPMAWVMTTHPGVPSAGGWFAWPVFIGWLLFGLVFIALLAVHVVRLVAWAVRKIVLAIARRPDLADPSRRVAIARITGGVVAAAVVGETGYGLVRAYADPTLVDVPVVIPRLPKELDGFTILQITDVHIGGTIGRSFVDGLVARANEIGCDLIALTGDFVDGSVADLADVVAPLAELRAKHGVYFITGNHEYYAGVEAWTAHFASLGNIRVLRNERVAIEHEGHGFDLAGIDDHHGHPDLGAALAGRDRSRALVLLAHQPRQVHDAVRFDVDLQLSGHTHGGQIWPWHYLVALQQGGLIAGRYLIGSTQLYVSRGAGYWGPPVRVAAPAELTRVILRATS